MLQKLWFGAWWIGYGIKRLVGLIVPFVLKARDVRGIGATWRWTLRILLLVLITGLLYWVSRRFELGHQVTGAPKLGDFWLPLLFLLVIGISWVGWWVYTLLYAEVEESPFPDVDEAWDEAVNALLNARIDPTEVPMFLVLGRAAGTEEALFAASKLSLAVKGAPARADAPLRVFANRDGIFVTCAGASVLGYHASILRAGDSDFSAGDHNPAYIAPDAIDDPSKTMAPGGRALEVLDVFKRAREQGRGPEGLTEEERLEIAEIQAAERAEEVRRRGKSRMLLVRNSAEVDRLEARFRHVCQLIVRDRRPFCPINGILLTIPAAASDTDEDAKATGTLCQKDLHTAREVLKVHCPVLAVITDLEQMPGFREFMNRFTESQKGRRVGQRFPYNPDLEGTTLETKLMEVTQWVGQALVPSWVHRLFRIEHPGSDTMDAAVAGNTLLYQFMDAMRERQGRLGRILGGGVTPDRAGPMMFGGCYLAGTGANAREQAFAEGVFQRLLQDQNYVSWTQQALAEEDYYAQWTWRLYLGLAVYAVLLAGATAWLVTHILHNR
jgi:hypothetical protein